VFVYDHIVIKSNIVGEYISSVVHMCVCMCVCVCVRVCVCAVPERAMVPRFSTNCFFDIPHPVSCMFVVFQIGTMCVCEGSRDVQMHTYIHTDKH